MARDDDGPKAFQSETKTFEGNLVKDVENIAKEGRLTCAVSRVAVNYRTYDGTEGVFYYDIRMLGALGDHALKSLQKGDAVFGYGTVEGREYEGKNGRVHEAVITIRSLGASLRTQDVEIDRSRRGSGGGGARDEGGSTRRSSSSDEGSGRSSRSSSSEDDAPRSSRRSSREEEPASSGRSSRRSRVQDEGEYQE